MSDKRILLVGGSSGGHAYPLVAVARALKEKAGSKNMQLELMMLGEGSFLKRAAEENKISYRIIFAGKLRRYLSYQTILDLIKMPIGFLQSLWYVFWFMPDAVFAKGGYDSFFPSFVAWLFFIPVYTHESDSIPGLTNTMLGKIASKVFISFNNADKYFDNSKIIFTGHPVRKNLVGGNKEEAWKYFDLHEPKQTILVLGGSQGAKVINEVILSSLVVITQKFNIIHQCGESQLESVKNGLDTILKEGTRQYSEPVKRYYRLYPFFDESQLSMAYAIADVIISRAGAGNLFEIAQLGKPAVIIPIAQSSANHQYLNAFEFSLSGGVMLEEKNFNRESLIREIELLINPENHAKISESIKSFATPDAADKIAEAMLKY